MGDPPPPGITEASTLNPAPRRGLEHAPALAAACACRCRAPYLVGGGPSRRDPSAPPCSTPRPGRTGPVDPGGPPSVACESSRGPDLAPAWREPDETTARVVILMGLPHLAEKAELSQRLQDIAAGAATAITGTDAARGSWGKGLVASGNTSYKAIV